FTTTQDTILLLKKAIATSKGQSKSECLSWGRDIWGEPEDDAFYRVGSILTRRAMRETPILGKTGGAHQAKGIQKIEHDSYARLMVSKPIVCKSIAVEPVKELEVKMDQVL
ncbi:hypothetical protein C0991_002965, partial [Blastosporella zonata]